MSAPLRALHTTSRHRVAGPVRGVNRECTPSKTGPPSGASRDTAPSRIRLIDLPRTQPSVAVCVVIDVLDKAMLFGDIGKSFVDAHAIDQAGGSLSSHLDLGRLQAAGKGCRLPEKLSVNGRFGSLPEQCGSSRTQDAPRLAQVPTGGTGIQCLEAGNRIGVEPMPFQTPNCDPEMVSG